MKCLPVCATLLATFALAAGPASPGDEALIAAQKPSYPLTTCPVSGEALGSGGMKQVDILHEGRLVSFCCKQCTTEFDKEPAKYLKMIDDAIIAAQKADYPLDTCPVSGEKLEGEPQMAVSGTKLVELCCKKCAKELAANPAKYLATLDAAYIEKQSKDYPLAVCTVTDEELGSKPVKLLHGTTLVEFCCKDCVKDFQKDPQPTLAKLAAARAAKATKPAEGSAPAKDEPGEGSR